MEGEGEEGIRVPSVESVQGEDGQRLYGTMQRPRIIGRDGSCFRYSESCSRVDNLGAGGRSGIRETPPRPARRPCYRDDGGCVRTACHHSPVSSLLGFSLP